LTTSLKRASWDTLSRSSPRWPRIDQKLKQAHKQNQARSLTTSLKRGSWDTRSRSSSRWPTLARTPTAGCEPQLCLVQVVSPNFVLFRLRAPTHEKHVASPNTPLLSLVQLVLGPRFIWEVGPRRQMRAGSHACTSAVGSQVFLTTRRTTVSLPCLCAVPTPCTRNPNHHRVIPQPSSSSLLSSDTKVYEP